MPIELAKRWQTRLLLVLTAAFLLLAPDYGVVFTDSGIYLGTAESLVETGEYRFNGHPNLLYYPGFPLFLSASVALFGTQIHLLHLLCAAVAALSLWVMRAYFRPDRYGLVGVAVPLLVGLSPLLLEQVFHLLSDGLFLLLSFLALLLWRAHEEKGSRRALTACLVVVAFAPLVRFQGLFLVFAFTAALLMRAARAEGRRMAQAVLALAAGTIAVLPFALWTLRNQALHTPDTFNMANSFFLGLKGLSVYAPSSFAISELSGTWAYGAANFVLLMKDLTYGLLGDLVDLLPLRETAIATLALVLMGFSRWFARANGMERAYVIASLAYILYSSTTKGNLHSIERYWLPLLPFMLVAGGLGLKTLHDDIENQRFRAAQQTFVLLALLCGFAAGTHFVLEKASPSKMHLLKSVYGAAEDVSAFVNDMAPPDATVATTDWGIMPRAVRRTCYPVLNDPSHEHSLARMVRYETRYLVVLDRLGHSWKATRDLVEQFPDVFSLLYEVEYLDAGPKATAYRVDIRAAEASIGDAKRIGDIVSGQQGGPGGLATPPS
jgi:hypothetical protein